MRHLLTFPFTIKLISDTGIDYVLRSCLQPPVREGFNLLEIMVSLLKIKVLLGEITIHTGRNRQPLYLLT